MANLPRSGCWWKCWLYERRKRNWTFLYCGVNTKLWFDSSSWRNWSYSQTFLRGHKKFSVTISRITYKIEIESYVTIYTNMRKFDRTLIILTSDVSLYKKYVSYNYKNNEKDGSHNTLILLYRKRTCSDN